MNKENSWVLLFFLIFMFIGVFVFRDYGIPFDEPIQRQIGEYSFNYVFNGNQSLFNYKNKYYGVAFELPLIIFEKILNFTDLRDVFLMRHFCNFLVFFIGAYFFFKICKNHFQNWKLGIVGSLLLVLSPRIFADSFYNSKDIVFLSVFIISIHTLIKFIEIKSLFRAFVHALICAILIDIRILGVLVPGMTLLFFCSDLICAWKKKSVEKTIFNYILFGIILIVLVVCFWPLLWKDTIYNFVQVFIRMSHYPWRNTVLYLGTYISAQNVPWHYIPVWLIITTPILYTLLFFIGLLNLIISFFKNKWTNDFSIHKKENIIFLLWFVIPLFYVIISRAVLYDAWRQMFFIYPAFVIIGLEGIVSIFDGIKSIGDKWKILNYIISVFIISNLFFILFFMIHNHPHQNVYFNFLAGNPEEIRNNYELDYWGLSYGKALKELLKKDKRSTIRIAVENYPGEINSFLIDASDRARLKYVSGVSEADYFLTNYRWHKNDYDYSEFFSIKVDGIKIMGVYKIK